MLLSSLASVPGEGDLSLNIIDFCEGFLLVDPLVYIYTTFRSALLILRQLKVLSSINLISVSF